MGNSRLDELIKSLHEAKKHETAPAVSLTEARSAEEYASYVSNWVGMGAADQTQNLPNPIVQQLLQHSQTLKQKAEEKVCERIYSFLHCESINNAQSNINNCIIT